MSRVGAGEVEVAATTAAPTISSLLITLTLVNCSIAKNGTEGASERQAASNNNKQN